MYLTVRVDLDYVPWDMPDAKEFGHGEPAMTILLLEMARAKGLKLHFFASNRVLRAFPTAAESVLNEGHHLDWLCKHPEDFALRYTEAKKCFSVLGLHPIGVALRGHYPVLDSAISYPSELKFLSCAGENPEIGLKHYSVETRPERDALRAGQTVRAWSETVRASLREHASGAGATVVVRPQVLSQVDPRLQHVGDLVDFGLSLGMKLRTLRERYRSDVEEAEQGSK
jgi:hypothetical protein